MGREGPITSEPGTRDARASTAGHRIVPHTADLIIEAWAPTREGCLEQAVMALVSSFVDARLAGGRVTIPFRVEARSGEEQLVALLEEILYLLDTRGVVPVGARLRVDDEGVFGELDVVPADVELVGAVPKGVSRHALELRPVDGRGWCCRAVIDV